MSSLEDQKMSSLSSSSPKAGGEITTVAYNGPDDGGAAAAASLSPSASSPKLTNMDALAIGYTVIATWIAYSGSISVALTSGGLNSLFFGLLICIVCNVATAASLGEASSLFPRGNQETWTFHLAPEGWKKALSYQVGWCIFIGYTILGLAGQTIIAQLALAMANLCHPDYVIERWHTTLCIIASCLFCTTLGAFGSRLISFLNRISLVWSIGGFLIISLVLLIESRGQYNTGEQALVEIVNESGWNNNFVPWVAALGQAALSTTAFDSVSHFAHEMKTPETGVAIGMVAGVGLNGVVGLIYAIVLCFTLPVDPTAILSSSTGFPFAQVLHDKTGSVVGTIFLLFLLLFPFFLGLTDVNMAAARIVQQYARQGGLPTFFARASRRFDCPTSGTLLVMIIQVGLSFIYWGSTSGFTSFISSPPIILAASYSVVIALMLCHARPNLTRKPIFYMGKGLGIFANILALLFALCITVFLCLPSTYPVTAVSMNYTSVIVVATLVSGLGTWYSYGRHHYIGPPMGDDHHHHLDDDRDSCH